MAPALPPPIMHYVEQLESKDPQALVAVFDRDGFYLYATDNHFQALGYTADELTHMHLSEIVDKSYHHAAWVLRTVAVLYTNPIRFSTHLVAKTGEQVKIAGTLRHMHRPERDRYFVTFTRPVSE